MKQTFWPSLLAGVILGAMCCLPTAGLAAERPHGLEPADDMPFIPDLGGLRHKTFKNRYGEPGRLAEGVVLRKSSAKGGKAQVPAGGFYYVSETVTDAAPFRGDPFLVLGEHAVLVDMKSRIHTVKNISLKRGEKQLVDETGNRLWFDYSTDHYDKPYIQLAFIAPSGHWPLEFPVSSKFPTNEDLLNMVKVEEGDNPQIDPYFADPSYLYGISRFTVGEHDFDKADFTELTYPVITEATFSMSRPWVLDIRQEDYRLYKNKRIYAFRRPEGFLVRVTDFSGSTILAEKVVRPVTPQGYKDRDDVKEEYSLTIPEADMRVEIFVQAEFLKHSDFVPWSTDVPFGWSDGILSFVVYSDLVTVKNGQAWPLDPKWKVGLEPNLLTGKLQRFVLKNAEAFTLDAANNTYNGPIKYSDFWDRPAFSVTAGEFSEKGCNNYYLRDAFYQRTDNLNFNRKDPRGNIDFFVGRVPTFIPILESTFLTRLADTTYGTVVEPSHFTSYPKVINNMAFHSPDPTAPFGGLQRGFQREQVTNRRGQKLTSGEGLVIRGSYVDWRNKRVVIPAGGLFYTSRNSRNVRVLHGESVLLFGRRAYLATFESTTFVRKNFDLDFWRVQPDGSMNAMFWQDQELGKDNKVLRFTQSTRLDDRPMGMVNVVKYSGNNFGAPFLLMQNADPADPATRYRLHPHYAEGATWIVPEFVGENYMRIKEFGTPSIKNVRYTFTAPARKALAAGQTAPLGDGSVRVDAVNAKDGTVTVSMLDKAGSVTETRTLGPLNDQTRELLPQHQRIVNTLQMVTGSADSQVLVEMDVNKPFEGEAAGLWLYTDLERLTNDTPLPWDDRFMVRNDVCGHCYQLNEILCDNVEPIVLDADNPVYDGPKGPDGKPLFRIVLASFDGEMIHAWYIETTFKNRQFRSKNLAWNPRTNVDVLMGVNGTVEGFLRASMVQRSAYQEYWRRGLHTPVMRGLDATTAHNFQ